MQNERQHISLVAELSSNQPKLLRSACDACHEQKIRCSGRGSSCTRCHKNNLVCHYSHVSRRGKPKGSKNKKTLEKERIKALSALESPIKRADFESSQRNGERTNPLADGLANHGLLASSLQPNSCPFSSDTLEYNFLDPMLEILEKEASSRGGDILPKAVVQEPIMLQDPSLSFEFSDCNGTSPQLRNFTKPTPALSLLSTSSGAESSGDWFEDDVPDILDTPSSSDVLSPPLSLSSHSTRYSRPVDPGLTAVSTHNSQRRIPFDAKFQCRCLQTYADLLCSLRQAEAVERFGNFMRITDEAYSTLGENLKCSQCLQDGQVMQICSMTLKTLVGAIGTACTTQHSPDIRSGDYVLQQEDSSWVGLLLLSRNMSRFKSILGMFKRRLDQSKITGKCGPQEQEYLDQVVQSIDESMSLMLYHIQATLSSKK